MKKQRPGHSRGDSSGGGGESDAGSVSSSRRGSVDIGGARWGSHASSPPTTPRQSVDLGAMTRSLVETRNHEVISSISRAKSYEKAGVWGSTTQHPQPTLPNPNYETIPQLPTNFYSGGSDPGYETVKNSEPPYASVERPEENYPGYETVKQTSDVDSEPGYETLKHREYEPGYETVTGEAKLESLEPGYETVSHDKNQEEDEPGYESVIHHRAEVSDPGYEIVKGKPTSEFGDPGYEELQGAIHHIRTTSEHDPNYEQLKFTSRRSSDGDAEPGYEVVKKVVNESTYEFVHDYDAQENYPPYEKIDKPVKETNQVTPLYAVVQKGNTSPEKKLAKAKSPVEEERRPRVIGLLESDLDNYPPPINDKDLQDTLTKESLVKDRDFKLPLKKTESPHLPYLENKSPSPLKSPDKASVSSGKRLNESPPAIKSPKGSPPLVKSAKGSSPTTKSPKGSPPQMKSPTGSPPVMKSPRGSPSLINSPDKGSPPLVKSPDKGAPPLMKSPDKGSPPLMKSPDKGSPPLMKSPKGSPPLVKSPDKGSPPLVKSPDKGSPPLVKSPYQRTPPLISLDTGTPPLSDSSDTGSPPLMESPDKGSPPLMESPDKGSPPVLQSPDKETPPLMKSPSPDMESPPLVKSPNGSPQLLGPPPVPWSPEGPPPVPPSPDGETPPLTRSPSPDIEFLPLDKVSDGASSPSTRTADQNSFLPEGMSSMGQAGQPMVFPIPSSVVDMSPPSLASEERKSSVLLADSYTESSPQQEESNDKQVSPTETRHFAQQPCSSHMENSITLQESQDIEASQQLVQSGVKETAFPIEGIVHGQSFSTLNENRNVIVSSLEEIEALPPEPPSPERESSPVAFSSLGSVDLPAPLLIEETENQPQETVNPLYMLDSLNNGVDQESTPLVQTASIIEHDTSSGMCSDLPPPPPPVMDEDDSAFTNDLPPPLPEASPLMPRTSTLCEDTPPPPPLVAPPEVEGLDELLNLANMGSSSSGSTAGQPGSIHGSSEKDSDSPQESDITQLEGALIADELPPPPPLSEPSEPGTEHDSDEELDNSVSSGYECGFTAGGITVTVNPISDVEENPESPVNEAVPCETSQAAAAAAAPPIVAAAISTNSGGSQSSSSGSGSQDTGSGSVESVVTVECAVGDAGIHGRQQSSDSSSPESRHLDPHEQITEV
ncbi:proline-rich protein 36-like [Procambarus clarkii]|uniref:proline-rich protein 36-like n=1 Tax=Procambarus clarkii TaxID=6728 RepID=UPI003744A3F5